MPAGQDELEARLRRSFTAGSRWPIDRGALAALSDMGLSDAEIGRHFGVPAEAVARLRTAHAAAERKEGRR